jgi:hypothetical protein
MNSAWLLPPRAKQNFHSSPGGAVVVGGWFSSTVLASISPLDRLVEVIELGCVGPPGKLVASALEGAAGFAGRT